MDQEVFASNENISLNQPEDFTKTLLNDYRMAVLSRETSLLGRREVLTGKAKFGIFGDGKEVAQIALAKQFQNGDIRSGYYRDQTIMMAIGELTIEQFYAQLYANPDVSEEPHSAGRQMNAHFATRMLDENGEVKNLTEIKMTTADMSPTAGQMSRLLGLGWASKLYRNNPELHSMTQFSNNGNEVAIGTIGDASTSEGVFWETINAAGVLQIPLLLSVWDDGHGISVPKKYQTTKESISDVLKGFEATDDQNGIVIYRVNGWDYPELCRVYEEAFNICRTEHTPVIVHVEELTQPQGHSTSGSHERYKTKERLEWEKEFDCNVQLRKFILDNQLASEEELAAIEKEVKTEVREAKKNAWKKYQEPLKEKRKKIVQLISSLEQQSDKKAQLKLVREDLMAAMDPNRRVLTSAGKKALRITKGLSSSTRQELLDLIVAFDKENFEKYNTHLHSSGPQAALNIEPVAPEYSDNTAMVDGRVIIRDNFDTQLKNDPRIVIFGEDSGKIGGVNQGLEGLQDKYGKIRVMDTGIRENTIIGQGIGAALRGLRPIAEIQYLDYVYYCIQILSDDLASLRYRTANGQAAPLIIRTRGHRLEGVWHSGSPMGMLLHSIRGIYLCTPRNMTIAAGFYNTLLKSDDPAIVIEPLNGYRLKEKMPENMGDFCLPLGIPETVKKGTDATVVTYGSCVRLVQEAARQLEEEGINIEIIDVQTLLPFDINHAIVESLKNTNRLVLVDEDVPGGATGFMMQQILEEQGGYQYLDSAPLTITAKDHRPAYADDGDYFSKSNVEDIFDRIYEMMHESNPSRFGSIYE